MIRLTEALRRENWFHGAGETLTVTDDEAASLIAEGRAVPAPAVDYARETRVGRSRYEFNPRCACEVCENDGTPPATASAGHSYCYGEPHIPPSSRA